jgi:uncharacterized protein (TIGR03083 family)
VIKDDYLRSLQADAAATVECARRDLSAPVPSCPGWDVAEVIAHLGSVHRRIEQRVRTHDLEGQPIPVDAPESGPELAPWFEDGAEALVRTLAAADPEQAVWSWAGPNWQRATFWHRRMAQETAVHRWDAEDAQGRTRSIGSEVAADGIGEWMDVFTPLEDALPGNGERVHLHRTDGPGGWTATLRPDDPPAVSHEHDEGAQITIRAGASDLLLLLWRRLPPSAPTVQITGDSDLAGRFLAWMDLT